MNDASERLNGRIRLKENLYNIFHGPPVPLAADRTSAGGGNHSITIDLVGNAEVLLQ